MYRRILIALAISYSAVSAQEPLKLQRIGDIDFDGVVSFEEWQAIEPVSMVSHWPTYAPDPGTRTVFRVTYNNQYLFFSAIAFDKPDQIQSPTFERDKWDLTMDQVALMLDTYNDNENGVLFVVTPSGSRVDVSVRNDAQNDPVDQSWNSFWEAKTSRYDSGWMAEVRIPFTSLRFLQIDKTVTMGLIVYRYRASEKQLDVYPDIPPQWGFFSFVKPSRAIDVMVDNVRNNRPWFTSPYALARAGYHHNPQEGEFLKTSDGTITAGLDVQHAVRDNINLDLTMNTDFAQVEVDDQVVNLTRFSLFFPEKRRFFQERAAVMSSQFDYNNRVFYSRRIGISDNGKVIPLLGGARLMGRLDKYDIAAMTVQSRAWENLPSENFSVFRLRRKISGDNSYIGGIMTSRIDTEGNRRLTYGLDATLHLFKSDYLRANVAQSLGINDSTTQIGKFSDRKRVYLNWENRSNVGFNYSVSYSQVDKSYDPCMGFEQRSDFKSGSGRLTYGWFPKGDTKMRLLQVESRAAVFYPASSHFLETNVLATTLYLESKKNSTIEATVTRTYDMPRSEFSIGNGTLITPGGYLNYDAMIAYKTPSVNFLSSSCSFTRGSYYGGQRISADVTPIYVISKYITLSGFYQFNRILFPGDPEYKVHVARLKIATSLNVRLSANAFVQVNSLTKVSGINFRVRYNSRDGNDFYLVYNEGVNNNREADSRMPWSDFRSLTAKYIYTFKL